MAKRIIITQEEREAVNRAVADAEATTAGEIVPVIARASGRYDRAEDLFGGIVAASLFSAAWVFLQREDPTAGGWDGLMLTLQLPALLAILIAGFVAGTLVATQVPLIRRMLTPASHRTREVAARAAQAFFDQRVHHAPSKAGLLIYVSLEERLAVLLADETVATALGENGVNDLRDALIASLRSGSPIGTALISTIQGAGRRLATSLPPVVEDRNELADALVVIA